MKFKNLYIFHHLFATELLLEKSLRFDYGYQHYGDNEYYT